MSEENTNTIKAKPEIYWGGIVFTIVVILATAAVIGGMVWYFMTQVMDAQAKSYTDTVNSMQSQIDELKKEATISKASNANAPDGVDLRILDLKSLTSENTSMGQFKETVFSDINNDGKIEAVVTFQIDGTGGMKDYFVYGPDGTGANLLFSEKGVGHGQLELLKDNKGIAIKYVDEADSINQGKPNSDMVLSKEILYAWGGATFIRTIVSLF